jgi:hypothetical protein
MDAPVTYLTRFVSFRYMQDWRPAARFEVIAFAA